ncbi:helix-turn-helix domain-containing protein [uncultured Oscillibacter sp.]|jgi:transcriptional regulator with XRE-family HTH domain|uniref:helix-turn-helix domain-containing protein n=1 Tax=uncultured Oscillibacter sp. TaxID=876091 RepID=UPI0025CBF272|nr:helix-turn-helix transcriptional regulator [uncultured Oscillibacter sp.]
MEFSERLRNLRAERKETQVQVADAVGISARQYQGLEGGTSVPNFYNLCALADHFGVTLDYLAGRTDER